MPFYKKRPQTVAAVQWRGNNLDEIQRFVKPLEVEKHLKVLLICTGGQLVRTLPMGHFIYNSFEGLEIESPEEFNRIYEAVYQEE